MLSSEKDEMFQRLVNIELKINELVTTSVNGATSGSRPYLGHPDQAFGHTTFSQFGEDLIVANIFLLLGKNTPSYLDVGAHHPLHVSNTALLHARGSRGVNIEANPDLIAPFHELRPGDVTVNVGAGSKADKLTFYRIDAFSGRNTFDKEVAASFVRKYPRFRITDTLEIEVLPLDSIVQTYCNGAYPDFLSIDVEGMDFDVLNAADFSLTKPQVICVEAVSGANEDASLRLKNLLEARGYELYIRTIGNLIMVEEGLAARLRV